MKLTYALKASCAALALMAGGMAQAGLFYLDTGADYTTLDSGQVCATCTSMKSQFTYQYESSTTITDLTNNGITVGDTTLTNGGLAVGLLESNIITGFTPDETGTGAKSNNGYGTLYGSGGWDISFSIINLPGVITGFNTGPEIAYGTGLIKMYIYNSANLTGLNFMNINVTAGGSGTGGTLLFGKADFTGISAAGLVYGNLIHSGNYMCGPSSGFYDIWTNCGINTEINFVGDFNTNVLTSDFTLAGFNDSEQALYKVSTNHDGSATFGIPEPGSLALFGLGLAGLGFLQRRRNAGQ